MGKLYTSDVLDPNFNLMLNHRDESSKDRDMATTQRGRLFPLYCNGVVICMGGEELDTCLQAAVQDVALKQNGWARDGTGVLVETVQDLCEGGHTGIVVQSLKSMVGDLLGPVRMLVGTLLDTAIPFCEYEHLQMAIPAVMSLAGDGDMDVKIAALNALCTVVRKVRDTVAPAMCLCRLACTSLKPSSPS